MRTRSHYHNTPYWIKAVPFCPRATIFVAAPLSTSTNLCRFRELSSPPTLFSKMAHQSDDLSAMACAKSHAAR